LPADLAAKREQEDANLDDDEGREPKSIRRSGRTRLPVKAAPLAAPSFIPVRRLGQDGDNTVTLRRNEGKGACSIDPSQYSQEQSWCSATTTSTGEASGRREDPASRQRALKEVFDEKAQSRRPGRRERL